MTVKLGYVVKMSNASPPQGKVPHRLLESALRDAVVPAGILINNGSTANPKVSERIGVPLSDSAVSDAVGPGADSINTNKVQRTESRLLDSAVREAADSSGISMTSGSSSRRTESRLLDSALRDAVGHPGASSNSGNPSRRTESGFKRLRSVVVAGTDILDSVPEPNGRYHQLKPRLDISKHGSKVPPGMAVALKAAAAAAEDVNNSTKGRGRSIGSVWDRLGNRSIERLGVKANEAEEVGTMDVDNEEVEGSREGIKIGGGEESRMGKRPRWRKVSDRLGKGPREEGGEIARAPDLGPGDLGYPYDDELTESEWHDSGRERMKDNEDMSGRNEYFEDTVNGKSGGSFRYGSIKDLQGNVPVKSQNSGSLQDRVAGSDKEKAGQGLQQGLVSGLSGAVNPFNMVQNIHINSNIHYLQSKDTDTTPKAPHDLGTHLLNIGASLEKSTGLSATGVDSNDVLEMKKRMRQVQLEMTKLRAKQAEVSKEAQKVGSTPGSAGLKARSQEEIDSHCVCVTNIHFAATKETISSHFSNCGNIVRVTVLTDSATGKPRGSAYVEFSSKDSVDKALNLNDSSLLSRTLKIVRKNAAMESIVAPPVGRPNPGSAYISVRAPGKFLRGAPLNLRRPSSISRPFPNTANLQWKRESSSPIGTNVSPNFHHNNGPNITPGRSTALRSPSSSLMGDRYGLGPIRMTRSMSYVRPVPYPP